ncbi:siphovirus Gp157 family protein [Shinella sp.]|uniref:siphovirus Gp157 family protein n=1 Tax=Shinella sp. TaxID=1870904 RepID=UPI0040360944
MNAEHSIARNTEYAKRLLASLRASGDADDAELVADTIEGETGLVEAIGEALDAIDEEEVIQIGLKAKEGEFAARRLASEKRVERIRATIEQAMLATEQTSFRLPTGTVTITKRAAGLIITNEADIPAGFWIEQERPAPKLDKKAILKALNDKTPVPGAGLDNGSYSLSLRRK